MEKKLKNSFMYGAVSIGCILLLIQDLMGKYEYIRFIDHYWMSGYISVPLAIFFLFFAIILHVKNLNSVKRKGS